MKRTIAASFKKGDIVTFDHMNKKVSIGFTVKPENWTEARKMILLASLKRSNSCIGWINPMNDKTVTNADLFAKHWNGAASGAGGHHTMLFVSIKSGEAIDVVQVHMKPARVFSMDFGMKLLASL